MNIAMEYKPFNIAGEIRTGADRSTKVNGNQFIVGVIENIANSK
jgi:hypothetical protein